MTFDIAIVGSGFAGSLLAMIARRLGRSVVLIEKDQHPRFAIGESSTPLANLLLEELAARYDLPRIAPLTKWGTWQREHPELPCGLKRGFSFFGHHLGERFTAHADRRNQLLVAASPRDEIADTHWFREKFDEFLAQEAQRLGAEYFDQVSLERVSASDGNVQLEGTRRGGPFRVCARWLFDSTGPRGFLHRALRLPEARFEGLPETEALFTHFTGVQRMSEFASAQEQPPFPPDDAALHHVFDGGWIWVLRFDNGVTSAGVAATRQLARELRFEEGAHAWERLLARLPTVRAQFAHAQPVRPFVHTPRLAFRSSAATGSGWTLLPSAAGFVDPLLSTGFALTLLGITRLADALEQDWNTPRVNQRLAQYERDTFAELDAAARLVGTLYRRMHDFPKFAALSVAYFAAVSFAETARRLERPELAGGFLFHSHPDFEQTMRSLCTREDVSSDEILRDIEPFNIAGLADESRRNWHPVNASDLFATAHKLGASRDEIEQLLIRSGFAPSAAGATEVCSPSAGAERLSGR